MSLLFEKSSAVASYPYMDLKDLAARERVTGKLFFSVQLFAKFFYLRDYAGGDAHEPSAARMGKFSSARPYANHRRLYPQSFAGFFDAQRFWRKHSARFRMQKPEDFACGQLASQCVPCKPLDFLS